MSTEKDYAKEEWLLLYRVPGMVGAAVLAADESGMWGTTKEAFVLSKEWAKGITGYPDNTLIKDLLTQKEDPEGDPIKDAFKNFKEDVQRKGIDQFMAEIVEDCGKAANLLDEKSDEQETAQYKAWIMTIGRKVAETAKEKGSASEKVSPKEETLLQKVAQALRV